jgi:hypothetical protein
VTSTNGVAAPPGRASKRTAPGQRGHLPEQGQGWDSGGMGHGLYRLDASLRVEGSHSRAIADIVEQEWRNAHPEEPIIRRQLGVDPVPARAWATAVFAGRTPQEARTDEQQASSRVRRDAHRRAR